ncbi:DUF222 domain-containing protein [Naumannella sp. ID2617S]|nr:DUF222 domain-containing protein [Naumannella sp. ID2617S]
MTSTAAPIDTLDGLQRVLALLDRIDHDARGQFDHEARLAAVSAARRAARRLDALTAILVAEADAAESSTVARGTPTTSWLAVDPATTRGQAAGLVFAGRDLLGEAAVGRAALDGEVSVPQARLVTKALQEAPDTLSNPEREALTADLLAHADELTPQRMPAVLRAALTRVTPEHVPDAETEQQRLEAQRKRAHARRHLRLTADGDGGVDVRGNLPALEAAQLVAALDAIMAADWRTRREAKDRLDPRDARTPEQSRADALIALAGAAGNTAGEARSARPQLIVTMSAEELRRRAEQAGHLVDGTEISAGDLRRLCCTADLIPAVLGTDSELLDVGRAQRLVTPALRRALILRDGGCAFPGCTAPPERCQAHHLVPWWAGGPTALHNLVLLCPHHHALVEPARFWSTSRPDRWEVRMSPTGHPEVIPPARVDPQRRPIPGRAA